MWIGHPGAYCHDKLNGELRRARILQGLRRWRRDRGEERADPTDGIQPAHRVPWLVPGHECTR